MADIASYTLFVRLLPAVFLFWLAWVVARSPYRSRGNQLLTAFFGLVGLEFFLEFLAGLLQPLSSTSAGIAGFVNTVLGVADPPLLLLFSLSVPRPHRLLRSLGLWSAWAAAGLAVLLLQVVPVAGLSHWVL